MVTVQMTIDEELLAQADRLAKELHTSRSALTRIALRAFLELQRARQMEEKHRNGYIDHPEKQREFSVWEAEQDWGNVEW